MRWGGLKLLVAAAATLALSGAAYAQDVGDYVWRNVVVGGGGFSPNIIFSRAERGLAYLRTDIGGAYRWDAGAATWIPLQDAMAEGNYLGAESVAPDPRDPNTVYIAAGMYRSEEAAMLRSRDRGATWDVFPVPFRMGGNEDGRGLGERLAVDPNDTSILYFGSRHDGLMRSRDHGATWSLVRSFPVAGRGLSQERTNPGLSFVVFDPASGARGAPTRTIFVGLADPGAQHLFRSDDAGETWRAVPGQPRADLLPVRAEIDDRGVLYLAYANGVGPNGITDGAVFKLDTHSGAWSDITPERGANRAPGGYMGLSLDRQTPGTLMVATINRWQPHDTIWRSTDGGATWRDIHDASRRDVAASPFLLWGNEQADFGWWMAGLAIDPFDSRRVAYTTGATVYVTEEMRDASRAMLWRPWVEGVEETAVITLASPPEGPPLLSGFGDISGFAHEDLARSPVGQFTNPVFSNTNQIDYAGRAPSVVVRSGVRPHRSEGAAEPPPTLAYSLDFGRSWSPLRAPPLRGTNAHGVVEERRYDTEGDVQIVVSADGSTFIVATPIPLITRDRARSWSAARGLPAFARPVADRVDPLRFYAIDFDAGAFYASTDGGATFARAAGAGLPSDLSGDRPTSREAPFPLLATPDHAGDLWYVSRGRLFHSTDGGAAFSEVRGEVRIETIAFGKAAPGTSYPAMFAIGSRGEVRAIWRSDDQGRTWIRLTGASYEFGRRFRCIAGDPRVYGRVYVGADGRGILYGEPRQ